MVGLALQDPIIIINMYAYMYWTSHSSVATNGHRNK